MSGKENSNTVALSGYRTGVGIFDSGPNSAAAIVSVIGFGAAIEHQWATVLACLSGTEIDAAMVLFEQLRMTTAQQNAIIKLAELKLEAVDASMIKTAVNALSAHRERRNAFAHGVWAQTLHEPDKLVLLRGGHVRRSNADLINFVLHGSLKDSYFGTTAEKRDFYGTADFNRAIAEAAAAYELMNQVANLAIGASMERQGHRAAFGQADNARRAILEDPSYQAALRKSDKLRLDRPFAAI